MGNQLVAYAPSLIRPAEYYLTDVPDLAFDTNLGSTRFLKVCRAKQGPVLVVVKIFVIHEHTLPIQVYCERLLNLRHCLSSSPSPNCLPNTKTISTEKSVIVIRPFVKFSLYDRMSTRPFIQLSEKLWIAFQLLCGLAQVHKHGLCHGDLKLENILITPGLRLLLCDFAPFKPVYLPRNNPSAIFGFFFDTAGRRCCYVAPERFHDDKSHLGADNLLTQEDELRHFLLPSMDIFSAGCCLIELFTEGRVPFDLSQLLSFCADDYDPTPVIELIENPSARELVSDMIQRNPVKRLTAEEYLTRFRGKLFPEVFYSTLQSYFDILAFQPLSKPDSRMSRLKHDIPNLPDDTALSLIFTSLVTAEVRGLKSVTAKLYALDSFRILSRKLSDECVLERVIPYIAFLLQDPISPRVRAEALSSLVDCLDCVTEVPPSDYNIFSGYIFPALERLDRDVAVRISLARNISRIAKISMRYLEASFLQDPDGHGPQQPQFVTELHSQRDTIASFLSNILTDNDPVVKTVLVTTPGSLEGLCSYFGRAKAHDILLSHLITFLNDKDDWHLRVAFFRCVPAIASFIGWHAAPLLIPLLKQGLSDVEEFVMREALITIKSLAEINFFGHRFLLDLLDEVLPFVIHPNLWLRNASVGVITSIKLNLSEVDVHCHVIPRLKVYLNPSSSSIWGLNEVSILSKVRKPLQRQVYESCSKSKGTLLASAIDYLINSEGKGSEPDTKEVLNFLIRLRAEGLPTPADPIYTAFLQKHVMKVNTQCCLRASSNETSVFPSSNNNGKGFGGFSQQQLQSHLLIMSTPPLKELIYPGSSSTVSVSDVSASSLGFPANRLGAKSPAPQFHANFSDKPRGILVAHLHEHSSCITKLCPLTAFKGLFASACRNDVRIWDTEKMEGRNVANRSRCHIRLPGEKNISNITYSPGANIIGVADDKLLYGFGLENMVAKCIFTLPINNQAVDIGIPMALESYSPYLMVVGTELGALLGFDTRTASKEVFRLQSDLRWGLLSSLCVDEDQNWMCTGTSKGILTCWDLRFGIPVKNITTETPLRRLKPSPIHPWGVFSSPRYQNEASLWNLETGSRHISLWASSLPPLSKQPESSSPSRPSMSIFGMAFVKSHNSVITAGSDMCIRWWDLNRSSDSYILVSPDKPEQPITGSSVKHGDFKFRLVDGVEVIYDVTSGGQNPLSQGKKLDLDSGSIGSSGSSTSISSTGHSYHHSNAHHNVITDLATVATPNQSFIISASADGVIKVWK